MGSNSKDKVCNTNDKLSATFYENNENKSKPFQVILSTTALCIRKEFATEEIIYISDIVGSRCSQDNVLNNMNAHCKCLSETNRNTKADLNIQKDESVVYLHIYCYDCKKKERRDKRILILCFSGYEKMGGNKNEAEKWKNTIKAHKGRDSFNDHRPVLVILNPKSGCGKARELFNSEVKPVLMEAELPFELRITKYANFATEFTKVAKDFLSSWRSIIVVGGDGLYWEVLNGILERSDGHEILNNLPIGIIPCGSGNGLARTIAHLYQTPFEPQPVLNAAITCVSGRTALMDVVRIQTKDKTMFSFLSVGWGLIADIDIESECLRFLGYQRFTLWSLYRTFNLRSYHGKLSYIRKDNTSLTQPSVSKSNSANWTAEEGDFVLVQASYQTHLGEDCFFVPGSQLNDGTIYLVIIRKGVSRIQIVSFLIGMSTGTHLPAKENSLIQVIPVTAFRIEPIEAYGILTVDGERIDYGPIEGEICPGVVKVMVPT